MSNGWKNQETYRVATLIQNDEAVYLIAKRFKNYDQFVKHMNELGLDYSLRDPQIDRKEMNELLENL